MHHFVENVDYVRAAALPLNDSSRVSGLGVPTPCTLVPVSMQDSQDQNIFLRILVHMVIYDSR